MNGSVSTRSRATTSCLRILLVEDNVMDAELIVARLEDEGFDLAWERVDTLADYVRALQSGPDLILSDWNLPGFNGLEALRQMLALGIDVPFVIVSGRVGEEAAIDALHQGAADYVLKDRLARLGSAIDGALERHRLRREHQRDEAQLRLAATVFRSSAEGVVITDTDGRILLVNSAFCAITGYTEEEVVGRNPRLLQSGRNGVSFYRDMWTTLLGTGTWRGELWNRRKDGRVYPEWMTISAVKDLEGRTTQYVGVFADIANAKQVQADLDFLAHHDALTRLPNRVLLSDRLEQAIRRAEGSPDTIAVILVDLDRFGAVNDAFGHPVGDILLKAVASRIRDQLDASDTLARFGGDEFAIVLEGRGGPEQVVREVRELQEWLAMPFGIEGHDIVITGTVGVSLFPVDAVDAAALLGIAEAAMRQAKYEDQNSIGLHEPGLAARIEERLALGRDLRGAAARGELLVHYQPQVSLLTGRLVGAEALARWRHPVAGMIPPSVFIPVAEELGVIREIGDWVLGSVCRQVMAWDAAGLELPRIAVNLSTHQLDDASLASRVRGVLLDSGLVPGRLELEVTESMALRHADRSTATIVDLQALGLHIAMDDFGTGFSSLAQLRHLPLDRLKIDLSFVRDIGHNPASEAIIRATIALAKSLELETVAEGVETEEQAGFLRAAGCDLGQGYLFGRPVPASDFLANATSGGLVGD